MPSYKFATTMWSDTVLPRDGQMVNPHFIINSTLPDMDALALEMCNSLKTFALGGSASQIQCRIYEDGAPKPNYPVGEALIQPALAYAPDYPREVALCLSYYATRNVKRHRGRLYLPFGWIETAAGPAKRPTGAQVTKTMSFGQLLVDLGGPETVWCVYSPTDGQARPVSTYWVDDEWDTQRRRGGRSTTRSSAATTG